MGWGLNFLENCKSSIVNHFWENSCNICKQCHREPILCYVNDWADILILSHFTRQSCSVNDSRKWDTKEDNLHRPPTVTQGRPAIVFSITQCQLVPHLAIHVFWHASRAQKFSLLFKTPCHDLSSNTKFQATASKTDEFCAIESNELGFVCTRKPFNYFQAQCHLVKLF